MLAVSCKTALCAIIFANWEMDKVCVHNVCMFVRVCVCMYMYVLSFNLIRDVLDQQVLCCSKVIGYQMNEILCAIISHFEISGITKIGVIQ